MKDLTFRRMVWSVMLIAAITIWAFALIGAAHVLGL